MTRSELMATDGVGQVTLEEIERVLRSHRHCLRGDERVPPLEPLPVIPRPAWVNFPLSGLNLPASVLDELGRLQVRTVGELCRMTERALPPHCREPVVKALHACDLDLEGPSAPDPMLAPLLRPVPSEWEDRAIEPLGLSKRCRKLLGRKRVMTVGQLCRLTPSDLLEIRFVGPGCLDEVRTSLYHYYLSSQTREGDEEATPPAMILSPEQWLNLPVELLQLSPKALDLLKDEAVETVGELLAFTRDRLLGHGSTRPILAELEEAIRRTGLCLNGADVPDSSLMPLLPYVNPAWRVSRIRRLDLSHRTRNALIRAEISTVGDLCRQTPAQLLSIPSIGPDALQEIRWAIVQAGVHLTIASSSGSAEELVAAAAQTEDGSVELLDLSARSANALRRAEIRTLNQLSAFSARQLLQLPHMGRISLAEVLNALAGLGRQLSDGTRGNPGAREGLGPPPDATNLAEWLDLLLAGQRPKIREVLLLRAGLYSGQPLALAEVGKRIGVTRERIRQMERTGRERLHRHAFSRLARFSEQIAALIRSAGGVARLADIAGAISHIYPANGVDVEAFARFTFPYCQDLVDLGDDLWAVTETNTGAYRQVVDTLEGFLQAENTPIPAPELLTRAGAEHPDKDPRFLEATLNTCPRFWIRQDNWVFLAHWKRGTKSPWVLVALREIGRPAHFTEIAARVRELRPELAEMSDHSVHAILGRSQAQVDRTDGGTFALKHWGVETDQSIVALLEEALEQIGGPAPLEKLTVYVMERKRCQEISIRFYLENDRRFLRLQRNVYALTRWVGEGDTEEPLAEIRSVPLKPDMMLAVLNRLVKKGHLSQEEFRLHLADRRQVSRADDYAHYLTRRGWAQQAEGGLLPTDEARRLIALPDEAERLLRFAMADANFQAYLILFLVEYLIRLSWTAKGAKRVPPLLQGGLTPLRPIYTVMADRFRSRCSKRASDEEREMHLLQVVRLPAVPQVFGRWLDPVTGHHPFETTTVLNWVLARMGTFPARPSTIHLGRIPRPEARLLFLATAVAARDDAAVDYRRLEEYSALIGMECPGLPALAAELIVSGVFVDDRDPSCVRLLSPHTAIVHPGEIPAGIGGDLDSVRASLRKAGVLVSRRDLADPRPEVRLQMVTVG